MCVISNERDRNIWKIREKPKSLRRKFLGPKTYNKVNNNVDFSVNKLLIIINFEPLKPLNH